MPNAGGAQLGPRGRRSRAPRHFCFGHRVGIPGKARCGTIMPVVAGIRYTHSLTPHATRQTWRCALVSFSSESGSTDFGVMISLLRAGDKLNAPRGRVWGLFKLSLGCLRTGHRQIQIHFASGDRRCRSRLEHHGSRMQDACHRLQLHL